MHTSRIKQFFRKIQFELEVDDITSRVRRSIEEKAIDKDHVDLVFARLDSNIREDNFIAIKNGETIHKPTKISWKNIVECL